MPIINQVVQGGGGSAPVRYLTFGIDNNGKLVPGLGATSIIDLTGCTTIDAPYLFYEAYKNNTLITGVVNMLDVQIIGGSRNVCSLMFSGCTGITSADLSSLVTISGLSSCENMFYGCTGITSVDLSSLTTLSGNGACSNMFQNCTGITSIDLSSLTTISGSVALASMFSGCTSLATVYIGGTTAINFGTYTTQFQNMFSNCTQNIDVYAPAANQAQIEAFSGYPNFGGTGTVTWHWRS